MQEVLERLQELERLRLQGKLDKAESLGVALVRKYPYYLAGLYTLGLVYLDKKNLERALDCLVRALMCDADNWKTLTALGLVYLRLGAHDSAEECLQRATRINPNDASILVSLGELLRTKHEDDAAIDVYRRAIRVGPALETAEIGLSACLMNRGRFSEAAEVLGQSIARGHRSLNILHLLASLPRGFANIDVVAELDRLQPSIGKEATNNFAFAYSTALDQAGRHAEAWKHLLDANRDAHESHRQALLTEVETRDAALKRVQKVETSDFQSDPQQPISLFILGPSRSGKTSLENLIRIVDGVKAGCENPIVEIAVRKTWQSAGLPASGGLENLPQSMWPDFRIHYLAELRQRAGKASVFTITVSERVMDVSILARILPNVRVLLVRRDRNDNALRIFMTKYQGGNHHAYSMPSIRAYLDWYARMQDLLERALKPISGSTSYEDLVASPAAAVAEAARLCCLAATPAGNLAVHDDRGCSQSYRENLERD